MIGEHADLLEIDLNNITVKLDFECEDYFLLIKKQKSGNHCLLFVTDFCANFWIKKLTLDSLIELKN